MKVLPQVFRTVFRQTGSRMMIDSEFVMPGNVGIYIEHGKIDTYYIDDNMKEVKGYSLEENDFIQDKFYYKNKTNELLPFTEGYEIAMRNGWIIEAAAPKTRMCCLFYNMNYNLPVSSNKIDYTAGIKLKRPIIVENSLKINLNQNDYLLVLNQKAKINDILKDKGSWFFISKDQTIDIVNPDPNDKLVLLLCE